ncbi:MAG: DUF3298 domain-containing protein [Eubacteriales bacterium]
MLLIKFPVAIKNQLYITDTVNFYYPYILHSGSMNDINYDIYNNMIQLINALLVPDLKTYISGSYEIKTNEKGVLSLSLIGLAEFGGAHPNTIIKSLNYDLHRGRNEPLSQQFLPNSNYVEILSGMVYQQLQEQEIPLFDDFPGIDANQDYYIADKSLVIYFQLYQVAPYVAGFPYAVIPIYQIQELIRDDGLLGRMIGSV